MDSFEIEHLTGQINALSTTLTTLISTLQPLPSAQMAMALAIEVESLQQAANSGAADDAALKLLTAFRDLASAVSRQR